MPRLLIDGRALTNTPKGVGRYAYHLCRQVDERLPPEWQMDILVFPTTLPFFPKYFRGRFITIPYASELQAGFKIIPEQIKALKSDILLRPGEGVGQYAIPTLTICHDINEWIATAQESQGQKRNLYRKLLDKVKSFFIGSALRSSEYVFCNSEFIRQAVCDYYKVNYQKTSLAYCAVDERFFALANKVNQEEIKEKYGVQNYILTFATGDYRENFSQLPKVIEQLRHHDIQVPFIIAGVKPDERYTQQLRAELREKKLTEGRDFIFEGFLGEDRFLDLVALYTAADFYLELSLHEGFGMQVIEAMACGTTCISSSKGALQEVTGDYALLIDDPTDTHLITDKIKVAYQDKMHERDNYQQIVYTKKFNWESVGKSVSDSLINCFKAS